MKQIFGRYYGKVLNIWRGLRNKRNRYLYARSNQQKANNMRLLAIKTKYWKMKNNTYPNNSLKKLVFTNQLHKNYNSLTYNYDHAKTKQKKETLNRVNLFVKKIHNALPILLKAFDIIDTDPNKNVYKNKNTFTKLKQHIVKTYHTHL